MISLRLISLLVVPAVAATTLGCRRNLAPLAPQAVGPPVAPCAACGDSVAVTYLGASGFLVRHGNDAVLTAPSFTHHGLLRTFLPFFPIEPDTELIRNILAQQRLDGVSAVLIGHSHHDHLLDAPFVATLLPPTAKIYGGAHLPHLLSGCRGGAGVFHAAAGAG